MFRKTAQVLMVVGLGAVGSLGVPDVAVAQSKGRYVTECVDGRSQARPAAYRTSRQVARRTDAEYAREAERSKTKTALMIGGSAAAGAGVGGAMGGAKGALIGAAVGGGAASIYEAVKRR